MLLNPDIKVSWVIAAQSASPQKYKLLFNFQENILFEYQIEERGHHHTIHMILFDYGHLNMLKLNQWLMDTSGN
jgi:hypothetical protein